MRGHLHTLSQLGDIIQGKRPVVWRTFFVPAEMINASGAATLALERLISAMAMHPERRGVYDYINVAEAAGHDRKQCSFVKGVYGLAHTDFLKAPSLLVTSQNYCSAMPALMRDLAQEMNWPHIHLNIPQEVRSNADYSYTADQMKVLGHRLCEITGTDRSKYENELLPGALELSNAAAAEWAEIQDLRHVRPDILDAPTAIDLAVSLSDDWGKESFVRSLRALKLDLKRRMDEASRPDENLVRLFWLHLRPYFPNENIRPHTPA